MPYEFGMENSGNNEMRAEVISKLPNGEWLIRFNDAPTYEGKQWRYAIPSTRHVGQRYFDEQSDDRAANILFLTDEQASSPEWLSRFDSTAAPETPWVVGAITLR
jgi:hypothetical protein